MFEIGQKLRKRKNLKFYQTFQILFLLSLFQKKITLLPSSLENISTSTFDSLAKKVTPTLLLQKTPTIFLFDNVVKKIDSLSISYNLAKKELNSKSSPLVLAKRKLN